MFDSEMMNEFRDGLRVRIREKGVSLFDQESLDFFVIRDDTWKRRRRKEKQSNRFDAEKKLISFC